MVYDNALSVRTSREVFVVSPRHAGYQAGAVTSPHHQNSKYDRNSPNSPSAVSPSTGKIALGPWQGAFGSSHSDTGSPIYLDSAGSGHFSLTDSPTRHETEGLSPSPAAHKDA